MAYHQRRYQYGRRGYGDNKGPKQFTNSWKPLPEWEKAFIVQVGAMPWKRFLAAKRNMCDSDKAIFEWDDSAGLQAFNEAKERFWENYHGISDRRGLPVDEAADMNIDNDIDWNTTFDDSLFPDTASVTADHDRRREVVRVEEPEWYSIPIEAIQATGWDDYEEPTPKVPSIVGS